MIKTQGAKQSLAEIAAAPAKSAAKQIAAFTVGLLFSRGIVFAQYAPFGIAAAAAAPYDVLLSVVLGGTAGYLLPSNAVLPVHYIAALLAAAAIRWTLSGLAKLRMHPGFAPATAFLPTLVTGLSIVAVNGSGVITASMYISEALLSGGAAYFFFRTVSAVSSGRRAGEWSTQEIACASLTAAIFILSISGLEIAGISIARVIAVIMILFAARYGGVSGGSVAGVTAGVVFSLESAGVSYLSGAYALGGLMAGLFSPAGRFASAAAFVLSNGIASLQVGNSTAVMNGLYEVMAATVIYMLVPVKAGGPLIGIFSRGADDSRRAEGLRRSVIMKLDYAAKALGNVSQSVDEVSKKLSTACAPDISGVYHKSADEVCCNCGLKTYCWTRNFNDSMNVFNDLTEKLRKKGKIGREDFSPHFATHCGRINPMVEAVNKNYGEFAIKDAAENRARQIRGVVAGQFETTSRMLEDMAGELELYEKFDFTAAQKVEEVLRLAGAIPIDVSCRADRFGRISVEAVMNQGECAHLSKSEITKEISRVCGRSFQVPCISRAGGECRIQMNEMPAYRVKTGCAQHICGNGNLCGDCWKSFPDGNGRQIVIISDGMGTGGRAAVDGAMACGIMSRLIEAGIGFDAAVKIVNSALIVKCGDESLSTMDIAALDLFNGSAEFMKAGAPESILRKEGKASVIDMPSLPIGILNDAGLAKSSDSLSDGDMLIMLSDGALSSGIDWVIEEIENFNGNIPQELAETIVSQAIALRSDGHDDDITVVVTMLCKYGKSDDI